jgi:hypothetical protein
MIVTVVVATLFAMFGSGVSLCAVVTSVTGVALAGVKVVVQVILLPKARVVAGTSGVQVVVAPAGAPVTVQVAFAAVLGPALVHIVVTVTGVPTVAGIVAGAFACISASTTGVFTHAGSSVVQLVGGVQVPPEQPVGGFGLQTGVPVSEHVTGGVA